MCDTFVIRRNGTTLFGKNSDREPGEAQLVVRMPPITGDSVKKMNATYIEIDQTDNRHGLLLSKPSWIWGAEMGANDRGVVIGNEAVFTRVIEKTDGLIGMDLVRLGLERGDTAEHAMHIITGLIEAYGQGGICGFRDKQFRYDNSFIIADQENAWVLESAGRHWAARKVGTFAAISNCITIDTDYDLTSPGLEGFAKRHGLFKGKGKLNFRETFESTLMPFFAKSRKRLESARCAIEAFSGTGMKSGLAGVIDILRRHQDPNGIPALGSNADICMHAAGPVRRSQTCGSMASFIGARSVHLFTGTSAPCLSVFKPADINGEHPFYVLNPDEQTVNGSLWQRFEPVHRHALFSDNLRNDLRQTGRQAENKMLSRLETALKSSLSDDDRQKQMQHAEEPVKKWSEQQIESYQTRPFRYPFSPFGWFWKQMNRKDGITV